MCYIYIYVEKLTGSTSLVANMYFVENILSLFFWPEQKDNGVDLIPSVESEKVRECHRITIKMI